MNICASRQMKRRGIGSVLTVGRAGQKPLRPPYIDRTELDDDRRYRRCPWLALHVFGWGVLLLGFAPPTHHARIGRRVLSRTGVTAIPARGAARISCDQSPSSTTRTALWSGRHPLAVPAGFWVPLRPFHSCSAGVHAGDARARCRWTGQDEGSSTLADAGTGGFPSLRVSSSA